jgi:endonuclease YncB( thermonuclease family)
MMLPSASIVGTWGGILGVGAWFLWLGYTTAVDEVVWGTPTVIDADTLDVGDRRIRLFGVDAPETRQACDLNGHKWQCGEHAALELTVWLHERTVFCRRKGPDSYGRMVAACNRGISDVGGWLVSNGWAVAATKYSMSYVSQENEAKTLNAGIWKSTFFMPWDWRKGARLEIEKS